ncbi:MAG: DUF2656 domain-containing protein [Cyanobacteria bacterium P01_F01_bin.143]
MDKSTTGRMLLSHNFDLYDQIFDKLTEEEFAQVFIDALNSQDNIEVSFINNPHWNVEILFSTSEFAPQKIGELCAQALKQRRLQEKPETAKLPNILILAGKKTTPPLSSNPTSLQPGEWGVDVVETASVSTFLTAIRWEERIYTRPVENIFKIELLNG